MITHVKYFLLGTCEAPTADNGRVSPINGTEISSDGTYAVGSSITLDCDEGYQRYGFYSFSDCVQSGIWVQPITECLPDDEGQTNFGSIIAQCNDVKKNSTCYGGNYFLIEVL